MIIGIRREGIERWITTKWCSRLVDLLVSYDRPSSRVHISLLTMFSRYRAGRSVYDMSRGTISIPGQLETCPTMQRIREDLRYPRSLVWNFFKSHYVSNDGTGKLGRARQVKKVFRARRTKFETDDAGDPMGLGYRRTVIRRAAFGEFPFFLTTVFFIPLGTLRDRGNP